MTITLFGPLVCSKKNILCCFFATDLFFINNRFYLCSNDATAPKPQRRPTQPPPQRPQPPPRATAHGVGTRDYRTARKRQRHQTNRERNNETTGRRNDNGETERRRGDGTTTGRDDRGTRRRGGKANEKKGPRDVERRLLGCWYVFLISFH